MIFHHLQLEVDLSSDKNNVRQLKPSIDQENLSINLISGICIKLGHKLQIKGCTKRPRKSSLVKIRYEKGILYIKMYSPSEKKLEVNRYVDSQKKLKIEIIYDQTDSSLSIMIIDTAVNIDPLDHEDNRHILLSANCNF